MLALFAGCGPQAPRQTRTHGTPVLRAVYRDATRHLLVVLPNAGHPSPPGDCAAPLMVDDATGVARQITPAEAAAAIPHMQLSGAANGTCP